MNWGRESSLEALALYAGFDPSLPPDHPPVVQDDTKFCSDFFALSPPTQVVITRRMQNNFSG
jgi:hypothetical protein